jgi:hypothetical protein
MHVQPAGTALPTVGMQNSNSGMDRGQFLKSSRYDESLIWAAEALSVVGRTWIVGGDVPPLASCRRAAPSLSPGGMGRSACWSC